MYNDYGTNRGRTMRRNPPVRVQKEFVMDVDEVRSVGDYTYTEPDSRFRGARVEKTGAGVVVKGEGKLQTRPYNKAEDIPQYEVDFIAAASTKGG